MENNKKEGFAYYYYNGSELEEKQFYLDGEDSGYYIKYY